MNIGSSLRRHARRSGVAVMVVAVLVAMAVGWLLDRWSEITEYLIKLVGLRKAEVWLKRQSLWLGLMFIVPMAAGFFFFKIYELHLLMNGRIILMVILGLVFKVVYATLFHYVLHIYTGKLLAIPWLAYWHHEYYDLREWTLAIVRAQRWYQRAAALKRRIVEFFRRRRSRWRVARRWLRRT